MDESPSCQNRRDRRSNVLMQATVEASSVRHPVKLRNLSAEGALVEGDKLPVEGAAVVFRRGDLEMPGTVVWTEGKRAGLAFERSLSPATLLRHVPAPRSRVQPSFRRPGLHVAKLSPDERQWANSVMRHQPIVPED
ncbi:PilZ domain-containing protein [Sphingomonas sp. ASV193]|uniref:PilZ domain-containing protein n=1 Tax=Sphingomonas sp. ASV193 TaxID=3144405 RepID=UPI0032E85ABD